MPGIKQPFINSKRFWHSFIWTVEHVRQHKVYKRARQHDRTRTSVNNGFTVLWRMDPRPPTAPTPLGCGSLRFWFPFPDEDFSAARLGDPWLLLIPPPPDEGIAEGVDLRFSFLFLRCCSSSLLLSRFRLCFSGFLEDFLPPGS